MPTLRTLAISLVCVAVFLLPGYQCIMKSDHQITYISGPLEGESQVLPHGTSRLGSLQSVRLTVEDDGIADVHLVFDVTGDTLTMTVNDDATSLNGAAVTAGNSLVLNEGDVVKVGTGDTALRYGAAQDQWTKLHSQGGPATPGAQVLRHACSCRGLSR